MLELRHIAMIAGVVVGAVLAFKSDYFPLER